MQIDSEAVLHTANPFSWWSAARKIAVWKPDLVIMKYWMSYLAPSLGTDSFTENIRKVKANLTWSAFAEALLAASVSCHPIIH